MSTDYKILGVNKNATKREIRNAYIKLVLEWHPDKNNLSDATEKFQNIVKAYNNLLKSTDVSNIDTTNENNDFEHVNEKINPKSSSTNNENTFVNIDLDEIKFSNNFRNKLSFKIIAKMQYDLLIELQQMRKSGNIKNVPHLTTFIGFPLLHSEINTINRIMSNKEINYFINKYILKKAVLPNKIFGDTYCGSMVTIIMCALFCCISVGQIFFAFINKTDCGFNNLSISIWMVIDGIFVIFLSLIVIGLLDRYDNQQRILNAREINLELHPYYENPVNIPSNCKYVQYILSIFVLTWSIIGVVMCWYSCFDEMKTNMKVITSIILIFRFVLICVLIIRKYLKMTENRYSDIIPFPY